MKDVNELIDKYFRGETTREEEKQPESTLLRKHQQVIWQKLHPSLPISVKRKV